jgi:hypothetical protein
VGAPRLEGRGKIVSFPADTFEWAIRRRLHLLKAQDVFSEEGGAGESEAVSAELASVNAELEHAKAFLRVKGFSPTIGQHVQQLEDRQREPSKLLADVQQQERTLSARRRGTVNCGPRSEE